MLIGCGKKCFVHFAPCKTKGNSLGQKYKFYQNGCRARHVFGFQNRSFTLAEKYYTFIKRFKMERKSCKEYSGAAIVEKEELQAIKSCFEELHMFISMRGDISSSEVH